MPIQNISNHSGSAESIGDLGFGSVSTNGPADRRLWLYWVLATFIGATAGGTIIGAVGESNFSVIIDPVIGGVAIGIMQSLVLRQIVCQTARWVQTGIKWTLTIIIGWILGLIAGYVMIWAMVMFLWIIGTVTDPLAALSLDITVIMTSIAIVLIGVVSLSMFQQRILRERFNSTVQWVWVSILGWGVAWAVGLGVAHITPGSEIVKWVVGGGVGGIMVSIITGFALVRLRAHSLHGDNRP